MPRHLFFALSAATCILANSGFAQVINDFAEYDILMRRQYERMEQRGTPQCQQHLTGVQDTGLTILGRWAWGPCQAVAAQGKYVYIGNGSTFQVLEMSNPASPQIVGELVLNYVGDIQVRGNLAYVCDGGSLLVIDISDPTTPTLISGIFLPSHADRVRLADSVAFVLGPGGWLQVVDIADPSQLRLRGGRPVTTLQFGNVAFTVSGRYAYVGGLVNCPCSVNIIDATNPDSLLVAGYFFPADYFQSSAATRDTLLLIGMPRPGYVGIYSINNPATPHFLATLGGFANVGAIEIHDTIAFIAATGRVSAVSIAKPSHPYLLGSVSSGIGKLAFASNRLHIAGYNSVYVLDVTRPDAMSVRSEFRVGGYATKVAVRDTLAFVASDAAGLWILSIADAAHPRGISNIRLGGYVLDVLVDGNYAYVAQATGLWIADVTLPQFPVVVANYAGIASGWGLAKMGNLVFTTRWPSSGNDTILEIVDVSNVAEPQRVGVVQANYRPYDIAVKDSTLYVAGSDSGLIIYDVQSPTNPIRIASMTQIEAASVALHDTVAVVDFGYFYVISIARPDSPFVVGSMISHYSAGSPDLAVSGNFAYWTDSNAGIVDISNPREPRQVWNVTDYGERRGVAVRGDTIFYAQSAGGLLIWKNNIVTSVVERSFAPLPSEYFLYPNYPNPFNAGTIIEFSTPQRERIRIEVFNVVGQKLVTIADGIVEAGHHWINFEPRSLSSGVYFYRFHTETKTITRPMIYIK